MVCLLLKHGAGAGVVDKEGKTLLQSARESEFDEIVTLLAHATDVL